MENQSLFISNFKFFLKHVLLVLLFSGFLIFTIGWSFEKYIIFPVDVLGASKVNRILNHQYNNEVPIFGSSRAQGSYFPEVIGDDVFNYGIDGVGSNIWLFFLEQELKKDKTSDIIINFDLSGFGDYIGSISNYIPNYSTTKKIIGSNENFTYNIPGIKYFGHYEYYFKSFLNDIFNITKVTQNGGVFEKNTLLKKKFDILISRRKNNPDLFVFDENTAKKFDRLIKSTKRKIFLVVAPYHYSYLSSFQNTEMVDNYLKKIDNNRNLIVIDLRDEIVNKSLFFNTTHLNYEGAISLSKILKKKMVSCLKVKVKKL